MPRIKGRHRVTSEITPPTVNEAMARFRASLLRRASAVGWVILIVIGAQAVRTETFDQVEFFVPMGGLAAVLVISSAIRWDRVMATPWSAWVSAIWLLSMITGMTLLGSRIPELTA